MFKKLLWRGALAAALLASPLAARAETLGDALAAAYENSGLLEQNRALLRAADEDVAQAVAALRPVISWAIQYQRRFGSARANQIQGYNKFSDAETTYALTASLLLYDGGQSRLGVEAAKESVLSAREQLRSIEQNVLLRAATAYVGVLNATETVQLRQNNVRLLDEELRAAQDRFEVGEVTRTDVALAEARRAAAVANLASARGALEQARAEYAAAVGREPGALQPISNLPSVERSEEVARRIAFNRHPDLRAAQRDVTVATINARRADRALSGEATLSGRYAYSDTLTEDGPLEEFSNSATVTLSFEQPIYQGGRILSLQRQAVARRDAALGNVQVVQLGIQQDVANALALLRIADAAISATREQIRAAEVAFNGVREEAQLGQRTTLDVLTAEQDLLNARTELTNAVADRSTSVFQLLAAKGLMTADHLGLDVQQYDPAAYYTLIENAPAISIQGDRLERVLRGIGRD